jgi:hypothetical protein
MSLFDDQNKTEITKHITAATCFWLDERGCKPVETEVSVTWGWIADIASVICPSNTELQELKLIRRAPKWSKRAEREAWEVEVKVISRMMTVVVEVKTLLDATQAEEMIRYLVEGMGNGAGSQPKEEVMPSAAEIPSRQNSRLDLTGEHRAVTSADSVAGSQSADSGKQPSEQAQWASSPQQEIQALREERRVLVGALRGLYIAAWHYNTFGRCPPNWAAVVNDAKEILLRYTEETKR